MKFVYGERVAIKGGFYDGSVGVVTDYLTRPVPGSHTEVVRFYKVLIMAPDWVSSEFFSRHCELIHREFAEVDLIGGPK